MLDKDGNRFKIGSGFDMAQRDEIWRNVDFYLGQTVVYKHQGLTKYGLPRFPIYKGIRAVEDIV